MTDIALRQPSTPVFAAPQAWGRLVHRVAALRRLSRRRRYAAIVHGRPTHIDRFVSLYLQSKL